MWPLPRHRRARKRQPLALLAVLLMLPACTSIGDFGRLQPAVVTDDIHSWVGQEAAARAGAPISLNNLTDDEHRLRDLAFPLIEPPYDRQRWDAVVYEYGTRHEFQRELWAEDPTAYYRRLQAAGFRSTAGRYHRLLDDIRNDVVRIGPFFDIAHRVVDLDQRRQKTMDQLPGITPPERLNALARVGENSLTIAWAHHSLAMRCAGYRFALEHLVVAEPEKAAAEAEIALANLQQQIAANQVVPEPHFAALPPIVAAQ